MLGTEYFPVWTQFVSCGVYARKQSLYSFSKDFSALHLLDSYQIFCIP